MYICSTSDSSMNGQIKVSLIWSSVITLHIDYIIYFKVVIIYYTGFQDYWPFQLFHRRILTKALHSVNIFLETISFYMYKYVLCVMHSIKEIDLISRFPLNCVFLSSGQCSLRSPWDPYMLMLYKKKLFYSLLLKLAFW